MAERKTKRVLLVLNYMGHGGIEAVVMNYYRFLDRELIQFDFAVCEDSPIPQKREIQALGGRIFLLPSLRRQRQYQHRIQELIHREGYEIVHCHMNTLSVFPLYGAWRAKMKVRICHNHTTAHKGEGMRTLAKYALRPFCRLFATDYFACGAYAARWMYGRKALKNGEVFLMRNAVDEERFRYQMIARLSIRKKLDLSDKFVVGHIGRFTYQKNHEFLIDIFREVYRKNPRAVLLLVGEGELEGKIRRKVKRLGLEEAVIFYGTCEDTSVLYQAMDVFCLPSFYEGLPVVAVEAQMNGLPLILSEHVTREAVLLESCKRLSLREKASVWAGEVLHADKDEKRRQEAWRQMEKQGFSIEKAAGELLEYYAVRS